MFAVSSTPPRATCEKREFFTPQAKRNLRPCKKQKQQQNNTQRQKRDTSKVVGLILILATSKIYSRLPILKSIMGSLQLEHCNATKKDSVGLRRERASSIDELTYKIPFAAECRE